MTGTVVWTPETPHQQTWDENPIYLLLWSYKTWATKIIKAYTAQGGTA